MKEHPIPYSPDMMAARRDGRKTQTRRRLRAQPPAEFLHGDVAPITNGARWSLSKMPGSIAWHPDPKPGILCPYGAPGDRLWTKERHAYLDVTKSAMSHFPLGGKLRGPNVWNVTVEYSDGTQDLKSAEEEKPKQTRERGEVKWRPAMFMHRWASRGLDEVTEVRMERLQEISEADAIAEGIFLPGSHSLFTTDRKTGAHGGRTATESYRLLWEDINGKGSWDANPWVWVVSFKVIR